MVINLLVFAVAPVVVILLVHCVVRWLSAPPDVIRTAPSPLTHRAGSMETQRVWHTWHK